MNHGRSAAALATLLPLAGGLAGCPGDSAPEPGLVFFVSPEHLAAVQDLVGMVGDDRLSVRESARPLDDAAAAEGGPGAVAVTRGQDCAECYRIDEVSGSSALHVDGGDLLGVQYGVTHVLELAGYRFFHPWRPHLSADALLDRDAAVPAFGRVHEPEVAERGLHLHTLHPIEGLYDVWVPSPEGLEGAKRIVDWTVKSRGDYLQWPGLDDVMDDAAHEAWRTHTAAVVDYAHSRGVAVGIGLQLFGASNLQLAYDLVDSGDDEAAWRAQMEPRLRRVLEGLDFDRVNLSFGEFFGADPEAFIAAVDLAYQVMQEVAPGIDVTSVIHVGDSEDLRIEYQGEEYLYYFLVQFADPAITPWVHSVMYYDLFEDAGGAYHHDEFDEHRAFLLERLAAGEAVGYFPESAYWVAFDNPVPTYLPLYVRSRWVDYDGIAREGAGPLPSHVLFSTGWEWGYWQNDYATLRFGFELPASFAESFQEMFAPFGQDGAALAAAIAELAEVQHRHLMGARLAGYLAGRDSIMDVGYQLGIVSQPERLTFAQVAALPEPDRAAFGDAVVDGLRALAEETAAVLEDVRALHLPGGQTWLDEVLDGIEVDALRAEYVARLYQAVLNHADHGGDDGELAQAESLRQQARVVVDRRHGAMHDPDAAALVERNDNPTIYDYGYLYRAEQLCFWEREKVQAEGLVLGVQGTDPGCAL